MFTFDAKIFFATYASKFPKPAATPKATEGLHALLSYVEQDSEVEDLRWVAYMLATVKHECANRWVPVVEAGSHSYFDQYECGTAKGARLGNIQPGDGFRYRGRGYVQITGRTNYGKLGRDLHLGSGLVEDPDRALNPEIAYRIMSYGMRNGTFTGRRLSQYINSGHCDYLNARKIINGLDQASRIELYAKCLHEALSAATKTAPATASAPTLQPPHGPTLVPEVPPVAANINLSMIGAINDVQMDSLTF